MDYLPQVIALLRRDSDPDLVTLKSTSYASGARPGHLLLILPEDGGKFSSPQRLASAIESVNILYEAFAELNVQSSTDLVVKSCDSGLDKVFEFHGLPDIMAKVKGTAARSLGQRHLLPGESVSPSGWT